MKITGWQLGNKMEEMKKSHPEYFLKAKKTPTGKETDYYSIDFKNLSVIFKREKVSAILKYLLFLDVDDASYSAGNNLYNDLKNYLVTSATETTTVQPDQKPFKWFTSTSSSKSLSWKDDNILAIAVLVLASEKVRKDSKYTSSFNIMVLS